MKRTIYIFSMLLIVVTTRAQITLENTYNATIMNAAKGADLKIVNLSNSGYKYALADFTVNQIRLYNLNHSIWRTINLATPTGSFTFPTMTMSDFIISDNLFNADNLVEVYYTIFVSSTSHDSIIVINENGSPIFNSVGSGKVFYDGANYKLLVRPENHSISVYSLPGTLPCNICGVFSGISGQNENYNQPMISNPFPNPTNDKTSIGYELPDGINQGKLIFYDINGKIVKEFEVDRTFKELQISNSDLSAGIYYYQLQTSKNTSGGKKLVVVK